jgi:hypothetical protein
VRSCAVCAVRGEEQGEAEKKRKMKSLEEAGALGLNEESRT